MLAMESQRAVSKRRQLTAVCGTIRISVQNQRHRQLLPQNLRRNRMEKLEREREVLEAVIRLGKCLVHRAEYIKGTRTNPSCAYWPPLECLF